MIAVASVFAAFAGVIVAEVLIARGTEKLPAFDRAQLDAVVGPQTDDPLHLVWVGDSTGEGVGASEPSKALPRLVATGLDRPVRLTVLAKSGARAADAADLQAAQLAELDADWIIVAIGSNDVVHLTSRSEFRRQLERLLDSVDAATPKRVVVLGVGQFAGTPLFAQPLRWISGVRARSINADVRAAAERHGALFVDIIGRVGRGFVGDPERYHAADRFHPSDDGYGLWAKATLDAIREAGW